MSITSSEAIAEQIVTTATRESFKISIQALSFSARTAFTALKACMTLLSNSKFTPKVLNSRGQIRLRKLQSFGSDLHAQEISPEIVDRLRKYLKKNGVDFSLEKNAPDGKTYVHFQGKDVDTMRHAITQALASMPELQPDPTLQDEPEALDLSSTQEIPAVTTSAPTPATTSTSPADTDASATDSEVGEDREAHAKLDDEIAQWEPFVNHENEALAEVARQRISDLQASKTLRRERVETPGKTSVKDRLNNGASLKEALASRAREIGQAREIGENVQQILGRGQSR